MPMFNSPRTPFGRGQRVVSTIDDNLFAGFNEGVSATGWAQSGGSGSLTQSASKVRLTASGAASSAALTLAGPSSGDALFLLKIGAAYTNSYSRFRLVAGATTVLEVALGYNYVDGITQQGTVSAYNNATSTSKLIATGVNYETTAQELLIHIDRNYNCVNVLVREGTGKWDQRCTFTYNSNYAALTEVQLMAATTGQWVEYDWLGFARPNFISIGDSICAGHTGFDPDPTYGAPTYANSWQKHALIYPALRNNYILNKGIGGQTSSEIHSRMATYVLAHTPRMVFLHASTNDQVQSISISTRNSNIQTDINSVNNINAKLVLLNAMYGTSTNGINPAHRAYMAGWWTTNMPTMTGVYKTIDIMTPMDNGAGYMQSSLTEGDQIHPNLTGYQGIGALIGAAGV